MKITKTIIEKKETGEIILQFGQGNNMKLFILDSEKDLRRLMNDIAWSLAGDIAPQESDFTKNMREMCELGAKQKIAIPKEPANAEKEIDWEQRRYEIAKDLYSSCERKDAVTAIKEADGLIEELKRK